MNVSNDLIQQLYDGLNRRDMPSALESLTDNEDSANGMDGGHVHGREAVREYWTKQWASIQPNV